MSLTIEKCLQAWTNSLKQMKAKVDMVFFGDSLVFHGEFASVFPNKVVCNLGLRGDTLQGMTNRVEQVKVLNLKTVYLMAGINDVANKSVEEFRELYESLVLMIRNQTPMTELIVFYMLPVNDADFTISCNNEQIMRYNEVITSICNNHGFCCIDLFAAYERNGKLPKEMTTDGIHLTVEGYDKWYKILNT